MNRMIVVLVSLSLVGAAVTVAVAATPDAPPQWQPGESLVDDRDGQQYRTVVIGSQVWMAENLNIGSLIRSTAQGSLMKDNGVIEKYCWDDDEANCAGDGDGAVMRRGGFYEWQEAVQSWAGQPRLPVRGICPAGWHLPSNDEWNVLFSRLGGATAYRQLVVGGGSGFDALMTGYRCTMTGGFRPSAMSADFRTYFWSANQTDAANAPILEIGMSSQQTFSFLKSVGLSVRCLWDGAGVATGTPSATTPVRTATDTAVPPTIQPTDTATPEPVIPTATNTATAAATETPRATDVPVYKFFLPALRRK